VTELAQRIVPPGHDRTWAELDEAIWNHHPRSHAQGQFYLTPYRDRRMGGSWERKLATPDFAGFCKYLVEFCSDSRPARNYRPNDGDQRGYGFGYLSHEAKDAKIPARPAIQHTGWKENRPAFSVSDFSSPNSADYAAIQWRIAEISAPGLRGYNSGQPFRYEIQPCWSVESQSPSKDLIPPPDTCAPDRTYRARARYRDATGRWSHWSEPVQFVGRETTVNN
jgi:hypothetical protein